MSRGSFGGRAALDTRSASVVLHNQGDGKKTFLRGAPKKRLFLKDHLDLDLGGMERRAPTGTDRDICDRSLWIGNLVPETHVGRLQELWTENGPAALPGETPATRVYQNDSPSKGPVEPAFPSPINQLSRRPP